MNETKRYVVLQETNETEGEAWLYFIRYEGNEEALEHLNKQLNQVHWRLEDDISVFDLDLEHFVSENTAKEMTKLELNHCFFHRKFDGKMKKIDLGFRDTDKNMKKMKKATNVLGLGNIEDYVSGEDIDPEDLATHTPTSSQSESGSSEETSSEEEEKNRKPKKELPKVVKDKPKIEIPRYAKAKKKH